LLDWNAFTGFIEQVHVAKKKLALRSHQEVFYPGHSDNSYRLLPSLYRQRQLFPDLDGLARSVREKYLFRDTSGIEAI
jgi:hypothetical protein